MLKPIRCPKCGRLLGYFKGEGETQCPRCRKEAIVHFDTEKEIVEIRAS
jgi:phage FluMu protein Com